MYVRLMVAAMGALFGAWIATAALSQINHHRLHAGADGLAEMMEPRQ